jgi:hypothetical protein
MASMGDKNEGDDTKDDPPNRVVIHGSIHPANFETSMALDHCNERAFEKEDSFVSHPHFGNRPIRSQPSTGTP